MIYFEVQLFYIYTYSAVIKQSTVHTIMHSVLSGYYHYCDMFSTIMIVLKSHYRPALVDTAILDSFLQALPILVTALHACVLCTL